MFGYKNNFQTDVQSCRLRSDCNYQKLKYFQTYCFSNSPSLSFLQMYNIDYNQLLIMKGGEQHHSRNMKGFTILLLIIEVVLIILYGVFVRIQHPNKLNPNTNIQRYPAIQDVQVMMLIGFGFLMAFSKTFSWSAIAYTFFMNAILVQLYMIIHAFWKRVLIDGFNSQSYYIYLNEVDFNLGFYSAASLFISLGCIIGRVGPLEILIMCVIHEVGYTLNEIICEHYIKAFDVGGSMVIHTFGAYQGIVISLILGRFVKPESKPHSNYFSNIFAFIGALFLWMYWPSFNFGVFATTQYTKSQIITNTILALTGSCLGTYLMSSGLKNKFTLEHLLNSTLAGGVVIGASAGIILNPGGSMAIGFVTGIISTLGFEYLTPYLQNKYGLYDTCGVHNLHGIPGLLGGIVSAIVAAGFKHESSYDAYILTAADFPQFDTLVSTPYKQGGLQIAATFISFGISIVTGLISGFLVRCVYNFNAKQLFNDAVYFQEAGEFIEELKHDHGHETVNKAEKQQVKHAQNEVAAKYEQNYSQQRLQT